MRFLKYSKTTKGKLLNLKMCPKIRGIDLFCGAGGVTHGFRMAGVQMALGVDSNPRMKSTYEKNNKTPFLCADIQKLTVEKIVEFSKIKKTDMLVLSSCAPCQPFSLQNNKSNKEHDTRKNLGFQTIRIIDELMKTGFSMASVFIENVPGFEKTDIWEDIEKSLLRLGFSLRAAVVNFANYGIPQNRKRFICLAHMGYSFFRFPAETHGVGRLPHKTVRQAFEGLSKIKAGQECEKTPNHKTRGLSPLNLTRISHVPKNGGSRASFPAELVLKCHKDFKGHGNVYGRMKSDKPSPTVTTRCISITNGRFGHPTEDRAISLREAARLQTFPDQFVFHGQNLQANSTMIGNAVPVEIARIFGQYIKKHIFSGQVLKK